ncbi:TIGR02147 family protein [Halobacteriovorax sp. RT-2-4]|uniref:TIGR02147 family protein n=1 Tax=unclassified Halobacteriovorax TaxID=2639665 RepID=UPI003999D14D
MNIYDFTDYREYLRECLGPKSKNFTRKSLSYELNCQLSFINQVLTFRSHLSLEHAIKTSNYLQLTDEEKDYFLLMVQKDRAGSVELERYFLEKINDIQNKRKEITNRIKATNTLTTEDQMKYYSSWYYVAIHILTALPTFNGAQEIATHLKLNIKVVKDALDFLIDKNFVTIDSHGKLAIGSTRIHLPQGSDMLPRHHVNWRQKAMESVDHVGENDLHYSSLLGISRKDLPVLKEKVLKLLEEFEVVLNETGEEIPVVFTLDLFEL